jgi:hypothetical protein
VGGGGFLGVGCRGRAVRDYGGLGDGGQRRGTSGGATACIPFFPCLACDLETCSSVRPVAGFTPRAPSTSSIGLAKALSMLAGVPLVWLAASAAGRCLTSYEERLLLSNCSGARDRGEMKPENPPSNASGEGKESVYGNTMGKKRVRKRPPESKMPKSERDGIRNRLSLLLVPNPCARRVQFKQIAARRLSWSRVERDPADTGCPCRAPQTPPLAQAHGRPTRMVESGPDQAGSALHVKNRLPNQGAGEPITASLDTRGQHDRDPMDCLLRLC